MTLTELHKDPALLREYLGKAGDWSKYRHATDPRKQQTHRQMIQECLREEFGMTRGSLDDRRAVLAGKYPKMYSLRTDVPLGSDARKRRTPPRVVLPMTPAPKRVLVPLSGPDLQAHMRARKVTIAVLAATMGVQPKEVTLARKHGAPDGQPYFKALDAFPIAPPAQKRSVIMKIAASIVWACLVVLGMTGDC